MGFFSRLFGSSSPEPEPESADSPSTPAAPAPSAGEPSRPAPADESKLASTFNEATPPISQDRIKAIFEDKGWRYFVDNDGDLGGIWDDNQFYFILAGKMDEILQIHGRLAHPIPMDKLDLVREFNLAWNRDKLWPKVFHRITDDGEIRVLCENTVDWEPGVSDSQVRQQIECALGTANSYFSSLDAALSERE